MPGTLSGHRDFGSSATYKSTRSSACMLIREPGGYSHSAHNSSTGIASNSRTSRPPENPTKFDSKATSRVPEDLQNSHRQNYVRRAGARQAISSCRIVEHVPESSQSSYQSGVYDSRSRKSHHAQSHPSYQKPGYGLLGAVVAVGAGVLLEAVSDKLTKSWRERANNENNKFRRYEWRKAPTSDHRPHTHKHHYSREGLRDWQPVAQSNSAQARHTERAERHTNRHRSHHQQPRRHRQ